MTTARPVKTRSEGQWALGDREPLNDSERIKHDDAPLNMRDRILNVYAKQGFDSIDKSDLRGRFRWMGLYTQREQGHDGTWTGDESIDTIEAKYFMMRVRSDGKPMSAATLRTLGQVSTEAIDRFEREAGAPHGRPRIKVASLSELLRVGHG